MKNFNDILQTLITVNDKLIDGTIDIEKAKVIGQNTQTLINAAKVQLDYCKQTKQTPAFLNELKPTAHKDIIPIEEEDSVDCYNPVRELV